MTVCRLDTKVLVEVLFCRGGEKVAMFKRCFDRSFAGSSGITQCAGSRTLWLQQAQLAGPCHRFSAPLDLEFVKDFPIVSFHRVQGER